MAKEFPVSVKIRAIDRLSAVIDKVKGKFPELASKARQATTAFDQLSKSTSKFTGAAEKIGAGLTKAGKVLTVGITLPAIAAAGYSIKAFADYERALVGVGKTSDIQGSDLQALGMKFVEMSKRVGQPATELMALGQTAAQLGVTGAPNILKFSETLAKLATATNIVGEEGATDLARFMKITGTDLADVDKIGSGLVALGNSSAATEAEILSFSTRLAGATALFGFSASQTLGYAAAMKSLGIEAEAGSSAVQRALTDMGKTLATSGEKAKILAKVIGVPLDQLKSRFKTDASGVLRDFAVGLGKVGERGGDMVAALNYFGMDGVRDIAVLGTLAKKTGELDKAMKTAADGIRENTALNKEFDTAMNTLHKRFDQVKAKVEALFISLGARLAPAATAVLGAFEGLIDFLDANPALATTLVVFVGILAVLGPILLALGTLITTVVGMITFFTVANGLLAVFGTTLWAATLPILIIIGKILLIGAAIALVLYGAYKLTTWLGEFIGGWDKLYDAIDWTIGKIGDAIDAMKEFTGLGTTRAQQDGIDIEAARSRIMRNPLRAGGAALGGNEARASVNRDFATQTNNARVDINVRAPQSTMVRTEGGSDFMSINRGLVGAF